MSNRIQLTFDDDGNPVSRYPATDAAGVQRAFFLDLIDLVGDEKPDFEAVMPLIMAVPGEMSRSVMSVTFAQLLLIINQVYDFLEANGVESKQAMRERWTALIEGLGGGDDA